MGVKGRMRTTIASCALALLCLASCHSETSNGDVIYSTSVNISHGLTELASDDGALYVASEGTDASIIRIGKSDHSTATLGACSSVLHPFGIDDDAVYVPDQGSINALSKSGGASSRVATGVNPTSIAIANGSAYWVDGTNDTTSPSVVYRSPLDGSAQTPIAMPDGVRSQGGALGIATDQQAVYVSFYDGDLVRIATADDSVTVLTSGFVDSIAVDDMNVYFVVPGDSSWSLQSVPKVGGPTNTLTTSTLLAGLAVDSGFVYLADQGSGGRIVKVPVGGGDVEVVADQQPGPGSVVIDDTHVYWDCSDGTVRTATK